jgi:beta-xylosidase
MSSKQQQTVSRIMDRRALPARRPKHIAATLAFFIMIAQLLHAQPNPMPTTFCNPLNLNYQALGGFREAADPAVILYKGDLYLFASKSNGYWWSNDMRQWNFVKLNGQIPLDGSYAPAVMVYHDTLYYGVIGSSIYASTDPKNVQWRQVSNWGLGGDPDLFADDDGKVYTYQGLDYCATITGQELNPLNAFAQTGSSWGCFTCNHNNHGWERGGNNNDGNGPYIEGSWMTKHNGIYYLQYAAPGTEFRIYADGVYTSSSPKGPFTYANNSPVSFKPRGFVTGAGHGSTFQDKYGNWGYPLDSALRNM